MAKRKDNLGRNLRTGESQRKDGRYMYRWTENGKERTVYSMDLSDLREKESRIQRDLSDGIVPTLTNKITVNEVFDLFINTKRGMTPSTERQYRYMYDLYIREYIGKKKIAMVKYTTVISFYNMLIEDKDLNPNSLTIIQAVLHQVFMSAVHDEYIRTDPTHGALGEVKKSHKWEKPHRISLSVDEQNAFIAFVQESASYSRWMPLFSIMLGTGCRIGEILGLRWEDCDLKNGTIDINHSLIYRKYTGEKVAFHITEPKTKAGHRTIPMLSDVQRILIEERKRQLENGGCLSEIDGYNGFIFQNRDRKVLSATNVDRIIKDAIVAYNKQESDKAKQDGRDPVLMPHFSAHNFRHTFCTRLCENETNLKVIQEIMGHSNISVTMDVYAEATMEKKRDSLESLEGKIKIC